MVCTRRPNFDVRRWPSGTREAVESGRPPDGRARRTHRDQRSGSKESPGPSRIPPGPAAGGPRILVSLFLFASRTPPKFDRNLTPQKAPTWTPLGSPSEAPGTHPEKGTKIGPQKGRKGRRKRTPRGSQNGPKSDLEVRSLCGRFLGPAFFESFMDETFLARRFWTVLGPFLDDLGGDLGSVFQKFHAWNFF